jgi:LPS sulfotransferase NodH
MQVTPEESGYLNIVISILSSSLVGGLIVFLLRTWISTKVETAIRHKYAVKLEQMRAEMARDQGVALERFKSDCQRDLRERMVRFESLHARQAEAIAGVYSRLRAFLRAVQEYVSVVQGPEVVDQKRENVEKVVRARRDLTNYYDDQRIYLTESTADRIDEFIEVVFGKAWDFRFKVVEKMGSDEEPEKWEQIAKFMMERAPQLFRSLENEFRQILGHMRDSQSSEPIPT